MIGYDLLYVRAVTELRLVKESGACLIYRNMRSKGMLENKVTLDVAIISESFAQQLYINESFRKACLSAWQHIPHVVLRPYRLSLFSSTFG